MLSCRLDGCDPLSVPVLADHVMVGSDEVIGGSNNPRSDTAASPTADTSLVEMYCLRRQSYDPSNSLRSRRSFLVSFGLLFLVLLDQLPLELRWCTLVVGKLHSELTLSLSGSAKIAGEAEHAVQ